MSFTLGPPDTASVNVGVRVTFVDVAQAWGTSTFTLIAGEGWTIRDPAHPTSVDGDTIVGTSWAGGYIAFESDVKVTKWLSVGAGP